MKSFIKMLIPFFLLSSIFGCVSQDLSEWKAGRKVWENSEDQGMTIKQDRNGIKSIEELVEKNKTDSAEKPVEKENDSKGDGNYGWE